MTMAVPDLTIYFRHESGRDASVPLHVRLSVMLAEARTASPASLSRAQFTAMST